MADATWIPSFPEVKIDIQSIKKQVHALATESQEVIKTSFPEIRGKVTPTIRQIVQEDFLVKSRGGIGADRQRWRKLARSTIERKKSDIIGIEFGEMFESLRVLSTRNDDQTLLEISYESPHAEFFDEQRPLLPDGDVPDWLGRMEPLVEEVVIRNIQKIVDRT